MSYFNKINSQLQFAGGSNYDLVQDNIIIAIIMQLTLRDNVINGTFLQDKNNINQSRIKTSKQEDSKIKKKIQL